MYFFMPELPEVETTIGDLQKKVLNRTFLDVWTDFKKIIKKPKDFEQFKKEIKGKKIEKIWRRGKNIIFTLSSNKNLLIHQKLTGHLLLGRWTPAHPLSSCKQVTLGKSQWKSEISGPLADDPMNSFLHLIFWLDNGQMLALSDLRKFAKVKLLNKNELKEELSHLGPEPLEKDFTFEKFKECLTNKKGKIKQILMEQSVIAGIGNIYSDEILWQAKIHPLRETSKLSNSELNRIYQAMQDILPKAIAVGGESISDFRRISGEKGGFDFLRKVYRREGEKCQNCGTIIKRIKLSGRSVHFCPGCQPLK